MLDIIREYYGIEIDHVNKLNGYDNENFLVNSLQGKFIFKTYGFDEGLYDILQAETDVLQQLVLSNPKNFPNPIKGLDGKFIHTIEIDGVTKICRMLTYLEGNFISDIDLDTELQKSIGHFVGKMDKHLKAIKNYVIQSRKWEWDLQYFELNEKYTSFIPDPEVRKIVLYFFKEYKESVSPLLPLLRKQIIHNDANDFNVLSQKGEITGIIDFGDLAYSPLINEVAIMLTYCCFRNNDPLQVCSNILNAYHEVIPLKENEIKVLYYLIAARLCTSICNSSYSRKKDPGNTYATSSEQDAIQLLKLWIQISPIKAESHFRKAIGHNPLPIENTKKLIQERHQHISSILSMSYDQPIHMNKAAFQYMYDAKGNTFLDAYNNIPHVGHCHPLVVEAGQKQMSKLNTNTRYIYKDLARYAEKLLSKFPEKLNKVFFVNSGSAASDLAIRLAKAYTQKNEVIVMEHGYHGNTQLSIDISDYKFNNPRGTGQKNFIHKTEIPKIYQGRYQGNDAGKLFAQDAISKLKLQNLNISAFISEPIVGCGGQVPLPSGYLNELYPFIRKNGGVCISDEVQTGFGRLGKHFWGFEFQTVIPDIVILGKPMGNGHPIGAVVTTSSISNAFEKGVEFFSSFGGNPVSCCIGESVLDVIDQEDLQSNALEVGNYYKAQLNQLKQKYNCIGDVRGEGLFLGVEIIDFKDDTPSRKIAHYIKNHMRNNHILLSTDGPNDNVIKTKPPLCFTKENVDQVVGNMHELLKQLI